MKDRIQRNYPEFHLVQEMKLLKDILRDMEDKMERSNVHLIVERREWAEQYLKKKKKNFQNDERDKSGSLVYPKLEKLKEICPQSSSETPEYQRPRKYLKSRLALKE